MRKMVEIRQGVVPDEVEVSCTFPLGNDFAEKVRRINDVKSAFLFDEFTLIVHPWIVKDETELWAEVLALIARKCDKSISKLSVDGGERFDASQVTVIINTAKRLLSTEMLGECRLAIQDLRLLIVGAERAIDRSDPQSEDFGFNIKETMADLQSIEDASSDALAALRAAIARLWQLPPQGSDPSLCPCTQNYETLRLVFVGAIQKTPLLCGVFAKDTDF